MRPPQRGFTLVEMAVVLAIAGVLLSMALPSYQAFLNQGRRSDAVAALTRVQLAQEQFRAHHGSYALRLVALAGAGGTLSTGGHYEIALVGAHASGYIARALPRETSLRDSGCSELTLTVADGIAAYGPSVRCWNR